MLLITIKIKGRLDKSWSECFEGFVISYDNGDETTLSGVINDQAAFYGLIGKLRDLGLQLSVVNSTDISGET